MAQSATVYSLNIELADMDRGVYETLDLRVARQPSETAEYMLTRVLAYCLEYCEGIAFTQGIAAGDEPAVLVRDPTGQVTAWIEVGLPDAERLHRGSKLSGRAVVYTHRDVNLLLGQLAGKKIHRAEHIPIYALERRFLDTLSGLVERRTALGLSVTERELFVEVGGRSLRSTIDERRLG